MPAVLCALDCFEVRSQLSAAAIAQEFSANLDPALEGVGGAIEVYRLERVAPDAFLGPDDVAVCRVRGWNFDFMALEGLHRELEELRLDRDDLALRYTRAKEALVALNSCIEASEMEAYEKAPKETRREAQHLRQQLAQSESRQQETKATVMALRNEFMHLVGMMSDAAGEYETYSLTKENAVSPGLSHCNADTPVPDNPKSLRHGAQIPATSPQLPTTSRSRRGNASTNARTQRSPGAVATPRPASRPCAMGVRQRAGGHSAGASLRQRQLGEVI